ncbi:MAG: hypothetical protein ABIQ60_09305 [Burkholderiaceae bacterium]
MLALALALVWLRPIDATAQQYVDSGLKRALVTFASARALNALISLAQSASVGVQIGAGASVQPGAVLDPLDDLVEQFSAIMLAATLSFAIQHLLIGILGAWPVSVLLSAVMAAWAICLVRGRSTPSWLSSAAIGLFFLSLAVPVASLASESTYRLLLAGEYAAAQAEIKASEGADEPTPTESSLEKLKRIWSQSTDLGKRIDELKVKAAGLVEHLIRLAAVFVVQTILLPIFFLWLMFRVFRLATSWPRNSPAPFPALAAAPGPLRVIPPDPD